MRQPIDDLIDKPLNELTEEEAEIVIEWKAAERLMELKAEEDYQEAQRVNQAKCDAFFQEAEAAKSVLSELKERALRFYESQV